MKVAPWMLMFNLGQTYVKKGPWHTLYNVCTLTELCILEICLKKVIDVRTVARNISIGLFTKSERLGDVIRHDTQKIGSILLLCVVSCDILCRIRQIQ
jgi:hypothetical protein